MQQETAQSHTATFASREVLYGSVFVRTTQSVHSFFESGVDIPRIAGVEAVLYLRLACQKFIEVGIFVTKSGVYRFELGKQSHSIGSTFTNDLYDCLLFVEFGLLFEVTDRIAGREYHFAIEILLDTCYDFEQGRFARAIETDDTNFCSVEERKIYVFENLLCGGKRFGYVYHRENYFFVVSHL